MAVLIVMLIFVLVPITGMVVVVRSVGTMTGQGQDLPPPSRKRGPSPRQQAARRQLAALPQQWRQEDHNLQAAYTAADRGYRERMDGTGDHHQREGIAREWQADRQERDAMHHNTAAYRRATRDRLQAEAGTW